MRHRGPSQGTGNDAPLDPVALTLAIWLGVVAGVTGLTRLSSQAETQANLARSSGRGPAETAPSTGSTPPLRFQAAAVAG